MNTLLDDIHQEGEGCIPPHTPKPSVCYEREGGVVREEVRWRDDLAPVNLKKGFSIKVIFAFIKPESPCFQFNS